MGKTILLFSGGLDSVCIEHILKPDVRLFIDLDTPVCDKERTRALRWSEQTNKDVEYTTLEGISNYELDNKILPGRNCYFVLVAANYGASIYLGSTLGDTTRDKDSVWASAMTLLLRYSMTVGKMPKAVKDPAQYEVAVPFKNSTKGDLVRIYLKTGGELQYLIDSYSCYTGGVQECGTCRACLRKYVALAFNGVTCYEHFWTDPRDYIKDLLSYSTHAGRDERELKEIREVLLQNGES